MPSEGLSGKVLKPRLKKSHNAKNDAPMMGVWCFLFFIYYIFLLRCKTASGSLTDVCHAIIDFSSPVSDKLKSSCTAWLYCTSALVRCVRNSGPAHCWRANRLSHQSRFC